jgi:hypothetical protein
MYGVQSTHSNGHEDRRFKFRCCGPLYPLKSLEPLGWTNWVNNYDEEFDFQCKHGHVLLGMHSKHLNAQQDRIFSFQCGRISFSTPTVTLLTQPQNTNYENDWDQKLTFQAGSDRMITGIYSEHGNSQEDRRFGFYSKAARGFSCS